MSQARLAEFIGISANKIRDAESGKTKISSEIATAIEKRFGYNFRWVLTGEGLEKGDASVDHIRPKSYSTESTQVWTVNSGNILDDMNTNLSPAQQEVVRLLLHYGNEAIYEDLKKKLLKIKAVMGD